MIASTIVRGMIYVHVPDVPGVIESHRCIFEDDALKVEFHGKILMKGASIRDQMLDSIIRFVPALDVPNDWETVYENIGNETWRFILRRDERWLR